MSLSSLPSYRVFNNASHSDLKALSCGPQHFYILGLGTATIIDGDNVARYIATKFILYSHSIDSSANT